ncbi:MAG: recombinase A [Candidatus Binatia bacterium]
MNLQANVKAARALSPADNREFSPQKLGVSAPGWRRTEICGRLAEISAWGPSAALTMACDLILEAQREGEPAAWIATGENSFFPPDVACYGIDLDALPVIRVSNGRCAARAADKLLRSGAFGLVIIDLGRERFVAPALQSRLLGLAGKHDSAVIFLTEKPANFPSLGSLISLRAQASKIKKGNGHFSCELQIIKDKRRGPGWSHSNLRHGPAGLR